jgi:hypothetical protein
MLASTCVPQLPLLEVCGRAERRQVGVGGELKVCCGDVVICLASTRFSGLCLFRLFQAHDYHVILLY